MSAILASLRIVSNHGSLATSLASRRLASTRTIDPIRLQDNSTHCRKRCKNAHFTLPTSNQGATITKLSIRQYVTSSDNGTYNTNSSSATKVSKINNSFRMMSNTRPSDEDKMPSFVEILDREIQDESAQLSQHLSSDQFPGFSVETDGADVKLTKQNGNTLVTVRFTVSSSLACPGNQDEDDETQEPKEVQGADLLSMPEFQVQIAKGTKTLELSCYFDDMQSEDESGGVTSEPIFMIDEMVMYDGEPKETEFAVSAEYFQDDFHTALLQYLAEHGIDDKFSSSLVEFATSYEKKQYISLMKNLKNFVSI